MELKILITGIIYLVLFLMTLFIIGYYIAEWGKRVAEQSRRYEKKYIFIQNVIAHVEVCDNNYDYIMKLLEGLGSMKYKDRERTSVLTLEFFRKYEAISKQRLINN